MFLRFFVEGQEATRIKPVELPVFGMLQELPEAFQSQGRKRSILYPAHEVTTVKNAKKTCLMPSELHNMKIEPHHIDLYLYKDMPEETAPDTPKLCISGEACK